jgi:hypothetical protein
MPEVAEVGEKCPYDGLGLAAVEPLEVIRRAADVVAEKPQYWVTGDAESGGSLIRGLGRQPAGRRQPLGYVADLGLGFAGGSAEPVEGGHRVYLIACHQVADAAVDDHSIIQRILKLHGQLARVVGRHGSGKGGFATSR